MHTAVRIAPDMAGVVRITRCVAKRNCRWFAVKQIKTGLTTNHQYRICKIKEDFANKKQPNNIFRSRKFKKIKQTRLEQFSRSQLLPEQNFDSYSLQDVTKYIDWQPFLCTGNAWKIPATVER
jgi:cobalamin-dependent methionine synthase I